MSEGAPTWADTLDMIEKMRDRERNTPPIGSVENPFIMYVPRWAEDQALAEGTTCQAKADEMFRYHIKVIIMEPL